MEIEFKMCSQKSLFLHDEQIQHPPFAEVVVLHRIL